jgi:pantoate--beta-alanine ligase
MTSHREPEVVTSIVELKAAMHELRARGGRIGLVPTMGALHDGHMSLVRACRLECEVTVATIFVNPTQFGPHEDLARYPRTWDDDLVDPPAIARRLEGEFRPGHFRGVATVVLKLFHLIPAHVAYFGQKDYQQCLVVRHMVADLNVPMEIRMCPIVREADGLAMSSRNRYLTETERQQAVALSQSLFAGRDMIERGECDAGHVRDHMRTRLTQAGIDRVDYVAVAEQETLEEVERITSPAVLLIAAHVGQTRLIDNCLVG